VFEEIGLELTKHMIQYLPLLHNLPKGIVNVYAGPIARAGCGAFRPSVIKLLHEEVKRKGLEIKTFGLGLSRAKDPLHHPAIVYWNTLRDSQPDLASSLILLYEIGEATGSTIESAVKELKTFNAVPQHIIFLIGAACIDQTLERLQTVASGIQLIVGSRWQYDETSGPTQFFLTHIKAKKWIKMVPKDWGRCVSGMEDEQSVSSFIQWIGETIDLSPIDEAVLFRRWKQKIKEKAVRALPK
jgi:hypothetical protein